MFFNYHEHELGPFRGSIYAKFLLAFKQSEQDVW